MAYDDYLAERIERVFEDRGADFEAKKMMGGLCFMVEGKMCCGIHFDTKKDMDLLMARVGPEAYEEALEHPHSEPMDFTGRPMKGFVFVTPEGFDRDEDLEYWIDLCLAYNPKAPKKQKRRSSLARIVVIAALIFSLGCQKEVSVDEPSLVEAVSQVVRTQDVSLLEPYFVPGMEESLRDQSMDGLESIHRVLGELNFNWEKAQLTSVFINKNAAFIPYVEDDWKGEYVIYCFESEGNIAVFGLGDVFFMEGMPHFLRVSFHLSSFLPHKAASKDIFQKVTRYHLNDSWSGCY